MPDLAGPGLDDPVLVGLPGQAHAWHLDLEHQTPNVAGQHHIAATTQHGARQVGQARVLQHGTQIVLATHPHQGLGARGDAKGVVRLKWDVLLQDHGRIVAFPPLLFEPAMPSFDTVCEPNMVEVRNAVDTSAKEIGTRFDFKGTSAAIELKDKEITIYGDAEFQLTQVEDILRNKLTKRNVDVRFLDIGKVEKIGGDKVKQVVKVREGIATEDAKKITKLIKESKLKVQASIQGDAVRVTGAKRDDLQAAMALLRKDMAELPLSFNNFRD